MGHISDQHISQISFLSNQLCVHCFIFQIWIPLVISSPSEAVMAFTYLNCSFLLNNSFGTHLLTMLDSEIMQMEKVLFLSQRSHYSRRGEQLFQ